MHRFNPLFSAVLLLSLSSFAGAQSVTSDAVGFTTASLLASSDTYVGVPFTRVPEFVGAMTSSTATTITVSGTPWSASQFKYVAGSQPKHYYVLVGASAAKEGHKYQITDNTTNSLTVTASGVDDASGIPASTQISIIPNWTPASIFPASDANVSFTPTTSPPTYKTLLRIPSYTGGINQPPTTEYYFSSGSWQRVSPAGVGDDDVIVPDGYFIVRNSNGAPTLPLTCLGGVLMKKNALPLITAGSPGQDNPAGLIRPLDVPLNATGLGPAMGANDLVLLYDNNAAGLDKAPSASYAFSGGHWRLVGDATNADRGNDIIPLGAGFTVRKVGGANTFWTNSFPVVASTALSRKVHNGTPFDISLPLFGTPAVEPRTGGGTNDFQVVMTFPTNVSFSGASLTSGTGSVANSSGSGTNTVTLNLTGVTNGQYATVTLANANDASNVNDVAVRVGLLTGDTNGDGQVNSGDVGQTKSRSGQTIDGTNFRNDVTVDGLLNSGDVGLVKSRSGTALP